jgi:hypothetical protein
MLQLDTFNEYSTWHVNGLMNMFEKGDALLSIYANDPDVYAGLDAERDRRDATQSPGELQSH